MTTKLEIIGPYTPDHPGPFCTRDGKPVEMRLRGENRGLYTEHGYISGLHELKSWTKEGRFVEKEDGMWDLMNAREVRVPREFWINEYAGGGLSIYLSKEESEKYKVCLRNTIHVREVVEGE